MRGAHMLAHSPPSSPAAAIGRQAGKALSPPWEQEKVRGLSRTVRVCVLANTSAVGCICM